MVGYVIVVEKEYKNSPDDMGTMTEVHSFIQMYWWNILAGFISAKVQKNPHLIIISEEIFFS